jgi:ABC-type antimicrobial peptide transport system permease subunit
MRNTMVAIIGAICGCVLGLLLYAGLADTGHTPLGGNDLMERGRGWTPVLFAVYGAIIGGVAACLGIVWRNRRSMPR